jgi:hypothetical protein
VSQKLQSRRKKNEKNTDGKRKIIESIQGARQEEVANEETLEFQQAMNEKLDPSGSFRIAKRYTQSVLYRNNTNEIENGQGKQQKTNRAVNRCKDARNLEAGGGTNGLRSTR